MEQFEAVFGIPHGAPDQWRSCRWWTLSRYTPTKHEIGITLFNWNKIRKCYYLCWLYFISKSQRVGAAITKLVNLCSSDVLSHSKSIFPIVLWRHIKTILWNNWTKVMNINQHIIFHFYRWRPMLYIYIHLENKKKSSPDIIQSKCLGFFLFTKIDYNLSVLC